MGVAAVAGVLAGLDEVRGWHEDFYRDLHRHPELSYQEHRTSAAVAGRLRQLGYETHDGVGGTGVVGVLGNGRGPRVLLRADMDALPVTEATGLPYASTARGTDADGAEVPVMHACGHDVHVTCLLAAAQLLAGGTDHWSGTLVVLFQPAEELGDGARRMVDDGLAEIVGTPDVALAQHVLAFPAGRLGTNAGPFLSAADSMRITVHGRGAHGSMPQTAVDPVVLAAMIVIRLQTDDRVPRAATRRVRGADRGEHAGRHQEQRHRRPRRDPAEHPDLRHTDPRHRPGRDPPHRHPGVPRVRLTERAGVRAVRPVPAHRQRPRRHGSSRGRVHRVLRRTRDDPAAADRQRRLRRHPTALGVPSTYWGIGGTDPDAYAAAERAGTIARDVPVNHSASFAPVVQPTLDTGTEALVVAALVWLGS